MRCLGVSDAGVADVYCLTVPGPSAFCVEGGHVVHNTRYLVMSGLKSASFRPPELVRSIIRPRKSEEWSPQRALERDGYGSLSR